MGQIRQSGEERHEGFVVGLVPAGDRWRELRVPDEPLAHVRKVQVACECGWRSPRLDAPLGTEWARAGVVLMPEWAEDAAERLWREDHMDRLPEGDPHRRLRLVV